MKKLFYSLITVVLLLIILAVPSFADSTSDALSSTQVAEIIENSDPVGYNKPYSQEDFPTEYIEPLGGSLTIKEDILYLPGKNGFDVNLSVTYNSNEIGAGIYTAATRYEQEFCKKAYYYSYDNNGTKEYILIAPYYEEEFMTVGLGDFYVKSLPSTTSTDDFDIDFYWLSALNTSENNILLTRESDMAPEIICWEENSKLEKTDANTERLNFSDIWKWNIPVITEEIYPTRYDYDDTYNYYKQISTFTDLSGEYCEVTFKYRKKITNKSISNVSITFAECTGDYTGYYTGEDIVDSQRGITYRCSITDSLGRTMFFTQEGFLCAVEDRFGNIIKYVFEEISGSKGRLLEIVDTLGRNVTFTYSDNDTTIYVTESATSTETLYAEFKNTRTNSPLDTTNLFAYDDECISKIIRYENEETDYIKTFKYSKYNQAWYTSDYTHHVPIECEVIKEIIHPNGLKTIYDYSRSRNIKPTINRETYSISERYDSDNTNKINQFTYTYSPGYYAVVTRVSDGQMYTYNGETRVSDMTIVFEDEEYYEEYRYTNRKLTFNYQTFTNSLRAGNERKVVTTYSLKRPKRIAYDDYEKTITYYESSSFVETEIYNQSEDVFVKTTYTLSPEGDDFYTGRTIDSATVSYSSDGGDTYTDQYTVVYTYNADGTLASQAVDPEGINQVTSYTYTYTNDGSIITTAATSNLKDADGNNLEDIITSSTVDYLGRLISSTDGNGNETTYEYDRLNRLVKVTNPDSTTVTYEYDTQNRTTIVTDENGVMEKAKYDGFGNILAVYKNTGTSSSPVWVIVAEYEYDALCRPVKATKYTGYSASNTPEKWVETHYAYGAFDNVSEISVYDEEGTELSKETYTYNTTDRLTTLNTSSPSWKHDNYNSGSCYRFTSVTVESSPKDGITPPTVKQYLDRQGRLCKQITTDGENEYISTYIYDAIGNVLEYKDESAYADYDVDYSQKFEYNYNSKVITAYNAEGNCITNTYDALGNQLTSTDYMGNTQTYTYDSIGRVLTASAPVDDNVESLTKYYYDANSNVTRQVVSAAAGDISYTYEYDSLNRPIASFNGATYSLNEYSGNRLIRTASGIENRDNVEIGDLSPFDTTYNVTFFTYDNLGNITDETTFNGTTTYTYDIAGNTLTTTDPKGITTINTYDSRANLLTSTAQDDVISYEYNAFNLVTAASRNGVTTTYTYDNFARNITETTGADVITRTYNTRGQVASMTLARNGTALQSAEYEYNVLGNMTSASDGTDTVVYSYNENGLPTSEEKAGLITTYEYTPGNLLKSTTNSHRRVNDPADEDGYNDIRDNSSFVYTYYPDGNVKTVTDTRGNTTYNTIYGYDAANRLTIANITQDGNRVRTWGYSYNNRGDRVSQTVTDAENVCIATIYTYTNHRLTRESTGSNSTEYRYDANGNTIAKLNDYVTYQYTYTPRNEVESVTTQSGTYSYTYNASSLRTSKTANGATTNFIWAGSNIIREENADKSTDYFYGINRVSRTVKGDAYTYEVRETTYDEEDNRVVTTIPVNGYHEFYAYDGRGNVVHTMALDNIDLYLAPFYNAAAPFPEMDLNCDGEFDFEDLNTASMKYPIVQNYYYSPFGEIWQGERTTDTNPFRYAGEYLDQETGDIYLRARYYDPSIGRFLTVDPIKDGTNWYVYCSNNPIAFVDPTGKCYWSNGNWCHDAWETEADRKEPWEVYKTYEVTGEFGLGIGISFGISEVGELTLGISETYSSNLVGGDHSHNSTVSATAQIKNFINIEISRETEENLDTGSVTTSNNVEFEVENVKIVDSDLKVKDDDKIIGFSFSVGAGVVMSFTIEINLSELERQNAYRKEQEK